MCDCLTLDLQHCCCLLIWKENLCWVSFISYRDHCLANLIQACCKPSKTLCLINLTLCLSSLLLKWSVHIIELLNEMECVLLPTVETNWWLLSTLQGSSVICLIPCFSDCFWHEGGQHLMLCSTAIWQKLCGNIPPVSVITVFLCFFNLIIIWNHFQRCSNVAGWIWLISMVQQMWSLTLVHYSKRISLFLFVYDLREGWFKTCGRHSVNVGIVYVAGAQLQLDKTGTFYNWYQCNIPE